MFMFHIYGTKFPDAFRRYLNASTVYGGSVAMIEEDEMDIALVPSLSGRGMQQKIFEPLSRGIPTITSLRGLNGYPFENGKHLLFAETAPDFASALITCVNHRVREKMSKNALALARSLFSQERLDALIKETLS
jgi:glycosyltransferase involved in cell wall biosynthesis